MKSRFLGKRNGNPQRHSPWRRRQELMGRCRRVRLLTANLLRPMKGPGLTLFWERTRKPVVTMITSIIPI